MALCQKHDANRARRALLWFGLFFCAFTGAAAWAVEHRFLHARDPEFAIKITHLRAQLERAPGQPLVVMLGSSRSALGFRAGDVHETRDGRHVLAYNFALLGGGPFLELLSLRRLLATGVHPDRIIIEVFPALLNSAGTHSLEEVWLQSGRLRLSEILRLEQYHTQRWRLIRRWARARLEPWTSLRWILEPSSQTLSADGQFLFDYVSGTRMDEHGWIPYYSQGVSADERLVSLSRTQAQYKDSMRAFHPAARSVAALNALLETCQLQRIPVALVLMPEGKDFRKFYAPGLREQLDRFVGEISRRWNVPLHDGRDWVAEADLADSHHALPSGAVVLTAHLSHEVIAPLFASPLDQAIAHAGSSGR
jgi:hypothetical protein